MNANETGKNTVDSKAAILPISVAAQLLNVHQRMLRIYDDKKVLCPARSGKNRRLYSFNDIKRGKVIQYLTQEVGLNLAGVKIIFEILKKSGVPLDNYLELLEKITSK